MLLWLVSNDTQGDTQFRRKDTYTWAHKHTRHPLGLLSAIAWTDMKEDVSKLSTLSQDAHRHTHTDNAKKIQ